MPALGRASPVEGLSSLATLLLRRLATSLTTVPSAQSCLFSLALLAAGGPVIGLCAVWAGAFSLPHANFSPIVLFKAIFLPSLAEELLWRALFIPNPVIEKVSLDQLVFWGCLSTVLYIAAHPLLAYTIRPNALPLFGHPGFLACCAVIGAICTAAYRRCGSIWIAVFIHWAVVAVWFSLGGRHKAPL